MKNVKEITGSIERLATFNKEAWVSKFKSEPDYMKVLDAYRTVVVSARAYDVAMEVIADASENMATDLVSVYRLSADKTLSKMIEAAAYLVKTVGTSGNEPESKLRLARYMHTDAVVIYNNACELEHA